MTNSSLALLLAIGLNTSCAFAQTIDIGTRRELFVDRFLIERVDGVELRMHRPIPAARPKSPLPTKHYITVIKDSDLYRAYWRSSDPSRRGDSQPDHMGYTVEYAESEDGIEWKFPNVGLHIVDGTRDNNVILANIPSLLHNFSPFRDNRPGVSQAERYKALAGHPGPGDKRGKTEPGMGLFAFTSPDGIHWTQQQEVIPYRAEWRHAFDSQNVAFWSEAEDQYVCYFRTWTQGERLRSISRTTSQDFKVWTTPVALNPNLPGEHLYTSQTHPYFRAPHIYVALPTRYVPGRGDAGATDNHNNATDILLMTSRAGSETYDRTFKEAFIRPGLNTDRWKNRANYVALNVVPTSPSEMSIYHRSGERYVLRTDGFASARAGAQTGTLLTRPVSFAGESLSLNLSTSAAGSLRVEIQALSGQPLPGFALDDCRLSYGDSIDMKVAWKNDPDLAALAGQSVRLLFVLKECDLYSFKFE